MPRAARAAGGDYAADAQAEVALARVRAGVAAAQAEIERRALLSWAAGNVSTRVTGTTHFVISPAAPAAARVAPERTLVCDESGRPVDGSLGSDQPAPLLATVHAVIHREIASAEAVVLVDAPYASAWALGGGSGIPISSFAGRRLLGDLVPVAPAGGERIAASLAAAPAGVVVVGDLGICAVGETLTDAVRRAVLVEDAARKAHLAAATPAAP